jgi:serine/threonine protein kinase
MTHVAGRYQLVEVLGRGGMGTVWRARDEVLGRDVAIKELTLPPHVAAAERATFCARTIREARSAARLKHPGIVTIHDVIQQNGLPWIVMEFVPGRSLGDVIDSSGPLPPAAAAEIGRQILDALRAAHAAGIVHRDVKPANVLLEDGRVVLTDFGIAALEGDATITQSGLILGTPAFMAPEQARGQRATERSDLWSLGATLYAAVEGGPPFRGPNSGAVFMALATEEPRPAVNAGPLEPILRGLLRKEPAHRLSADQTARLLGHIAAGEAGGPEPPPPPSGERAFTRAETAGGAGTPPPFAQSAQQLFDSFRSTLDSPPGSPTWAEIPRLWWTDLARTARMPRRPKSSNERLNRLAVISPLLLIYPPAGFLVGLICVIRLHRRGDHGWRYKVALIPALLGGFVVLLLVLGFFAQLADPSSGY